MPPIHLVQIWFEATNRSRERTISRDNFYVACRLVAQVQNNGQPLRAHMRRGDALGLPEFNKPVTRVRRDSYILSPPPSPTAASPAPGHAASMSPSSLTLPLPPPSLRRRASMPVKAQPNTPNRSPKPPRRDAKPPLSAAKSSPARVATPVTSPLPLATGVPIPTSATPTQITMTAAVPISATGEVSGPIAHAVALNSDTASPVPPPRMQTPNLKAGEVNNGPKKAQRWTNPWEASSSSLPPVQAPNKVTSSQNCAAKPRWTNPWESYGDLASALSPPHSSPSAKDDKKASNWTNPWGVRAHADATRAWCISRS